MNIIEVPAFKAPPLLLRISIRTHGHATPGSCFHIHVEGDDRFQLVYDTPTTMIPFDTHMTWSHKWHRLELEGRDPNTSKEFRMNVSPLPLFSSTPRFLKLELSLLIWYLWNDLENIGPQLTTLHLDIIEGIDPGVSGGEGVRQGETGKRHAPERMKRTKGIPTLFFSLVGFRNQDRFILGFQHASPVPPNAAYLHIMRLFIYINNKGRFHVRDSRLLL